MLSTASRTDELRWRLTILRHYLRGCLDADSAAARAYRNMIAEAEAQLMMITGHDASPTPGDSSLDHVALPDQ